METTRCLDTACDAHADVSWGVTADGVDFDGERKLFRVERVTCARGHGYDRVVDWDPAAELAELMGTNRTELD
jgi:hypothetical protein